MVTAIRAWLWFLSHFPPFPIERFSNRKTEVWETCTCLHMPAIKGSWAQLGCWWSWERTGETKIVSSSRSRNSNSCKEPAEASCPPTKRPVAAEVGGGSVGPRCWARGEAQTPGSAEMGGHPGALQLSCWGSAGCLASARRETGDARMLLAGMSGRQRLCVMRSNEHRGWLRGGWQGDCQPLAATQPSPGVQTGERPFLAQREPRILSSGFSGFCLLSIFLLLSESLPDAGCRWCSKQRAESHPAPKLWEGNTADKTQAFISRRPLTRGGCPSLSTFCVLGSKCDWVRTAHGCWQALGTLPSMLQACNTSVTQTRSWRTPDGNSGRGD